MRRNIEAAVQASPSHSQILLTILVFRIGSKNCLGPLQHDLPCQYVLRRQHRPHQIHRDRDDEHVEHRADTWPLAQWNPQRQHEHRRDRDDRAEGQPGAFGEPLVQHVPRGKAETGPGHHGHAGAVEAEPGQDLGKAASRIDRHGHRPEINRGHRSTLMGNWSALP